MSSPVEEIKSRLDIVDVVGGYVKLQKAGLNYRAVCPFHSEKSPSFFVSPSRQIWHCFGSCGEGGDIFKFVMKIEGVEFGDALRILAAKAGVELKKEDPKIKTERQRMYEISEIACSFFEKQLESLAGKEVKQYLTERGIKEETFKKWRIGYSPESWQALLDFIVGKGYQRKEAEQAGLALKSEKGKFYDRFRGRIVFPVFNSSSQVIGFGGRAFKNDSSGAKYINTPATLIYDKSRALYGINSAVFDIRKKDFCIIVEGYMDVIMVNQAGFQNVVASSGTALTTEQLRMIKRYTEKLYTAFDMDVAGNSATKRGIELAQSLGFDIKVIIMKEGSDPADIVKESPKEWERMVKEAKSIHDFYFQTALSSFDKETIEGKKAISKYILPVIKKIPNKIEQNLWIKDLAKTLDVREEDVLEEFSKAKEEPTFIKKEEKKEEIKKTRRDVLEEYLISLLLGRPNSISFLKEDDYQFFSQKTAEMVKDPGKISEVENNSALVMKSEIENLGDGADEEIQKCLGEIKKLSYKEKLENIAFQIKKKEEEKNEAEVEKLKGEYNQFLKLFYQQS